MCLGSSFCYKAHLWFNLKFHTKDLTYSFRSFHCELPSRQGRQTNHISNIILHSRHVARLKHCLWSAPVMSTFTLARRLCPQHMIPQRHVFAYILTICSFALRFYRQKMFIPIIQVKFVQYPIIEPCTVKTSSCKNDLQIPVLHFGSWDVLLLGGSFHRFGSHLAVVRI